MAPLVDGVLPDPAPTYPAAAASVGGVTVRPHHGLPRSALLACWLEACLHGRVSPDQLVDAVRSDDPQHLLLRSDGTAVPLLEAPGRLAALGARSARLALPAPGNPIGLAGPPAFNAAALDAGEAVLLPGTGTGLVPRLDARTVIWQLLPAEGGAPADPAEAGTTLRQTLLQVTDRLVALDVASWQPEIPDLLMNLRHRDGLPLPPGIGPRRVETAERAVLCLQIVRLATADEGGAVSSYEMGQRRAALADLDRAARRALVAACSDSCTG
jgi:hypothetical protein